MAVALLSRAQNAKIVATQDEVVQRALIGQAQAASAQSEYDLKKTIVFAPTSGRVATLRIRVGQYATVGKPAVAIVADNRWRVIVNLPERHLSGLSVGQSVWFSLSSDHWLNFHRATVRSIAPGVARSATALEVLPYVEPTTDWVRLPRRFPVEIDMGSLPNEKTLFQGSDATVWMIKLPWRSMGGLAVVFSLITANGPSTDSLLILNRILGMVLGIIIMIAVAFAVRLVFHQRLKPPLSALRPHV